MGILKNTLGEFHYSPPSWLTRLGFLRAIAALLILLALALGAQKYKQYLDNKPVPPRVVGKVIVPGVTSPHATRSGAPQDLLIDFSVVTDPRLPMAFVDSVAKIDLVGSPIPAGISLSPGIAGSWYWDSETRMRFIPEEHWPAEQEFTVNWSPEVFASNLEFGPREAKFTTASFNAALSSFEFYQNPAVRDERKLVATLTFSHAVEANALKDALTILLRESGDTVEDSARELDFELTFNADKRIAYVHSEPLEIPPNETFASLTLSENLQARNGPGRVQTEISQSTQIPDVRSYFRVSNSTLSLVRDEQDTPHQTIMLEFTDRVSNQALRERLEVYMLPTSVRINGRQHSSKHWNSPREVTPDVLSQAEKLQVTLNPSDGDFAKFHSVRLDEPEQRPVYVRIRGGLSSEGGFVMASQYDNVMYTPRYAKEVQVAQDGSILPLSGSHKISFVARGLETLRVDIARVLDGNINHLASQTRGDLRKFDFRSYQFDEDNLSERNERFIDLIDPHPRDAAYAHVDLSEFLPQGGFYLITVSGWDRNGGYTVGQTDKRLVQITDLGLLVKNSTGATHDVFVHSLNSGTPIANASVELLGKNGLPIATGLTNARGHLKMDAIENFTREKTPSVYVVRNGSDAVFLPYNRYDRQINYSRFEVGGDYNNANDAEQLRAQLFTERDLFRPGDAIHIGAIVKRNDWRALPRVPLILQVRDARGQTIAEHRLRLPSDGLIEQRVETQVESPTGTYSAVLYTVESGNRRRFIGNHEFKVQEFQPDRLKIRSEIRGQKPRGWIKPENLAVQVQLDNLFGTPAAERRITGNLELRPAQIYFKEYSDYTFVDPLRKAGASTTTVRQALEESTTNNEGSASIPLAIDQYDQGIYELNVYTEGFEVGGGRSVKSRAKMMLSPLDNLVGYKSSQDLSYVKRETTLEIEFLALNNNAEPVDLKELKLELLEQRFVSTLVKQANGTFAYQSVSKDYPLSSKPFSISQTGNSYSPPTDKPGRYVVVLKNQQGHLYSRVPFTVTGAGNLSGNLEKNAELDLSLNSHSYAAGDSIEMNITAPYTGSGLITIERDSVVAYKWFRATTTSTTERITLPPGIEGNAYINVTFVRALDSDEIYTSPLSYAIAPFSINRDARKISVNLDLPEKVIPGEALNIRYSASRKSRMILFAVDEGILQVANYATPQPLDFFLRKMALQVSTYQLADLILPEFQPQAISAAPGGGEGAGLIGQNLNPFSRKTEAPVVYWSGIVEADQQTRTLTYSVPDYFNGQLRVMAVVVADDSAGNANASTLVRGPFVVTPNLLTATAPGDEFMLNIGIANNIEGGGSDMPVTLSAEVSEHLQVLGDQSIDLNIDEGREAQASFRLKALDVLGGAEVMLTTSGGGKSISRRATLSVRPPVPRATTVTSAYDTADPLELMFKRDMYPQFSLQEVAASASPLVLTTGLQNYLDGFAHACAEQIVSKVFPLLGLMNHQQDFDRAKFQADFSRTIAKLRTRQTSEGGFRFWATSAEPAQFPSVYIAHFLTEAKDKDLVVPADMLRSALEYLKRQTAMQGDSLAEARLRAYAAYVLTRNGVVTTNYLTNIQESLERHHPDVWRQDLSASYLAASYSMLKLEDLAAQLIDGYQIQGGNEMFTDFDTRLSRNAQHLFLISRHFPVQHQKIKPGQLAALTTPIMQNRFNTLSASFTVLALSAYTTAAEDAQGETLLSLRVDDDSLIEKRAFLKSTIDYAVKKVSISGGNDNPIYTVLTQTGFDRTLPSKARADGLEIDRRYLDANGDEVTKTRVGNELTVRLRIRSTGQPRSNVAIVDLLPGGFEVLNETVRESWGGWSSDYRDVREDRVVIYGSFDGNVTEITYKVKATSVGSFIVPAAYASSMYDRDVQAYTAVSQFDVAEISD